MPLPPPGPHAQYTSPFFRGPNGRARANTDAPAALGDLNVNASNDHSTRRNRAQTASANHKGVLFMDEDELAAGQNIAFEKAKREKSPEEMGVEHYQSKE
jgi:hypothetical protein